MGRPQNTFAKRQREQAKREKQQMKAARRLQRKTEGPTGESDILEMEPMEGADLDEDGDSAEVAAEEPGRTPA